MSAVGPAYRCDNHTEFSCRTNYRCVPLWAMCNGHDDCRDNSDEQNCGEPMEPVIRSFVGLAGEDQKYYCDQDPS